ncbi:MAG: hypothetical protein JST16_06435 [Bdellovibrionales bacterium]|nr:hypothetical protein [Bdellovibrionales bacterium]
MTNNKNSSVIPAETHGIVAKSQLKTLLANANTEFPKPKFRSREITMLARRILSAGGCLELRAIGDKSAQYYDDKLTKVGFYDNIDAFVRDCEHHHGKKALFVGINARRPDLLHALKPNCLSAGEGAKAQDVISRSLFPIDIDTIRSTPRIAASDLEIESAFDVCQAIRADLLSKGIHPAEAFSGNGLHLLIPTISYPNSDELNDKKHSFALLLRYFQRKHGTEHAKVDENTFDIGRVWKIYGTAAVKGGNTKERPHRTARFFAPEQWPEPSDILEKYAAEIDEQKTIEEAASRPSTKVAPKKATATGSESSTRSVAKDWAQYRGNLPTLDIVELCKVNGSYVRPVKDHIHSVKCPWRDEHSSGNDGDGSTVVFESREDGWPGWHCKHDHCSSRGLSDFLATFDPGEVDRHCASTFRKSGREDFDEALHGESGLPEIVVTGRQPREVIEDCWRVIHRRNEQKAQIFRRGNFVIEPTFDDYGNGSLLEVAPVKMTGLLIRSADIFKQTNERTFPTTLPDYVPRDMTAIPDPRLPSLNTITGSPYFSKSGQLVVAPGYHAEDEIFLNYPSGASPFEDIKSVSADEARAGIDFLMLELLSDFPFAEEFDRMHMLIAFLQPPLRKMIAGPTPMLLINAATPGSGKSLAAQLASVVATGQETPARVLSGNEDERKKMFLSELIGGRPIVLLDNLDDDMGENLGRFHSGKLHSPSLASVLTSTLYTDRVLGVSRMVQAPNEALWLMTGNNPNLSLELNRRCVSIRIEAEMERPWERSEKSFRHPQILRWVKENRRHLLEVILIAIQSWIAAGQPTGTGKTYGSYESWSVTMRSLLGYLGFEGFLANQGKVEMAIDPFRAVWIELVNLWHEEFGSRPVTTAEILGLGETDFLAPLVGQFTDEASRKVSLGKQLSKQQGRIYNGYKIAVAPQSGKDANLYVLIPVAEKRQRGSGGIQGDFERSKAGSGKGASKTGNGKKASPMSGTA